MKKVICRELSNNMNEGDVSNNPNGSTPSPLLSNEPVVRTTGRIKKPKAVFDPSDNYLSRAQRLSSTSQHTSHISSASSSTAERRASYTKTNISPVSPTGEPTALAKDTCVVCKKRESKRPSFANKNRMISCLDCEMKIHKLCLSVDFEDVEYLQSHYKCDQCANCCICGQKFKNPEEQIMTCSKCVKSFHIICFPTKIEESEINHRNWKCNKCHVVYNHITNGTTLPVKKIREIIGGGEPATQISPSKSATSPTASNKTTPESNKNSDNSESTSSSSPIKRSLEEGNKKNDSIESEDSLNNGAGSPAEKRTKSNNQTSSDQSLSTSHSSGTQTKSDSSNLCYSPNEHLDDIPDVKQWSVDQVHEYFLKHFPKEAHVFKDEEIDGRSLLLLKRSDVVKKLPIKLGPSLRIYSLILKIQAQLNDPTLGWNCGL